MTSSVQKRILEALLMTLRPIAKALLRSGIGYREFADMAKVAFVNVAAEEFGVRGRYTNTSRIAVMTGISRKEVKKIRDLGPGVLEKDFVKESPASIVLQYWHSDPDFVAPDGQPRVLEIDHAPNSFANLVSKYAGDIPPGAMRSELKRVGAVQDVGPRRVKAIKRIYMPQGVDERLVIGFGEILSAAADTLAHNCQPLQVPGVNTRMQGVSSVDGVAEEFLEKISKDLRVILQRAGNEAADYLTQYENSDPNGGVQAGIGLFYYQLGDSKSRF